MSKHPSQYTPYEIYALEGRLRMLASQLEGEQKALVNEGADLLLNQAVRLSQVRLALEVRG